MIMRYLFFFIIYESLQGNITWINQKGEINFGTIKLFFFFQKLDKNPIYKYMNEIALKYNPMYQKKLQEQSHMHF